MSGYKQSVSRTTRSPKQIYVCFLKRERQKIQAGTPRMIQAKISGEIRHFYRPEKAQPPVCPDRCGSCSLYGKCSRLVCWWLITSGYELQMFTMGEYGFLPHNIWCLDLSILGATSCKHLGSSVLFLEIVQLHTRSTVHFPSTRLWKATIFVEHLEPKML